MIKKINLFKIITSLESKIQNLNSKIEFEINENANLRVQLEIKTKSIRELEDTIFDLQTKLSQTKSSLEVYSNERANVRLFCKKTAFVLLQKLGIY